MNINFLLDASKNKRIRYDLIAGAEDFYSSIGYRHINAPWVILPEADRSTNNGVLRPEWLIDVVRDVDVNLPASGEQSFAQMIMDGKLSSGQYFTTTPCWRLEKEFDDIHLPYFIKTELISTLPVSTLKVDEMVDHAISFFQQHITWGVEKVKTGQDSIDIIDSRFKIELGSYGIRHSYLNRDIKWIYGTGCAEPRLSTVQNMK